MIGKSVESGISVVLPAHGTADFLSKTLKSVFDSSLQPDEILLVDDGLDSGVVENVNLHFPSVTIVPNEGKGLVDALNTGITKSRFDLIARIDADDLMQPERLELQMREFRSHENLILLGSQIRYIDEFGNLTGHSAYPVGDVTVQTRRGERCVLAHPSVMYRRDAVLSAGGYRHIFRVDNVDLSEDFDLWIRMSRMGQVVNSEDFLTLYRQHGSQLSNLHRTPQEISSIYIWAVSRFESAKFQTAPHVSMRSKEPIHWSSIKFVFDHIGFRQALRFTFEILALKKLINASIRRLLSRTLRY
jgi:glycosyltransferase involved in cell wall biosynthesis